MVSAQNVAIILCTVAGPFPVAVAVAVRMATFGLVLMFDFVVISICVFRQIIVFKVGMGSKKNINFYNKLKARQGKEGKKQKNAE